jgi:hypothetical protein
MPAPATFPTQKQFIGFAKETTPGTPVAMVVTMPVDSFDPEDKVTALIDTALRGSMAEEYNYIQGVKHSEFTGKGPMFMDAAGYLVMNILGDITTTGASAPFSHAISLLNSGSGQPGTLTITDWQGLPATNLARQYTGCCLSELTISGKAESDYVMCEWKGLGWASNIAAAPPTSAPTTALPLASWRSLVGLAGPATGGTLDSTLGDWELKITRKLDQIFTAQNSQNPYITQRGSLAATMKLDFSAPGTETNAYLAFINATQPQIQIVIDNGLATTFALGMTLDVQVGAYDTDKIDRGAEAVAYSGTVKPMANTTNAGASGGYSPVKVTLRNALAAGTY